MSMSDVYILITGILVAVPTSLLGSFLLLRGVAMLGDAISHGVLPGIVLAFLLSNSRNPLWMLCGASVLGMGTAYVAQWMEKKINVQSDASIGISFTTFFAIGVILISAYARQVDIDQHCVLYGEMAYVPLDLWFIGDMNMGPRALYILGTVNVLVLGFVAMGYRRLLLGTFDMGYAVALGIGSMGWQYGMMGMVSLSAVAAFEVVGAILVVAFLVVPAACAYLISGRVRTMLGVACGFGVSNVVLGYAWAWYFNGSIAGAMASAGGLLFLGTVLYTKLRQLRIRHYIRGLGTEK